MEEKIIKAKGYKAGELPVSTPEKCLFCAEWVPISEHLAHDLALHMTKLPMCAMPIFRTYTAAEKEYLDAEKQHLRVGVEGGDDHGRRESQRRPGSHALRRAARPGPVVGADPC